MVPTTVNMVRAEVNTAVRMFGTYTFQDKGAREVMDLDKILDVLMSLKPDECADVLCALAALGDDWTDPSNVVMETLVSDLLVEMQDAPDEVWDVLMSRPTLRGLF